MRRPTRLVHLSVLAALLAAMVVLVVASCSPHKMYRPNLAEFLLQREGYTLGVVEFDDHGEFWDRKQFLAVLEAVREKNSSPQGVLFIVFVHGWKNDASPQNAESGNLASFDRVLREIAAHTQQERSGVAPRLLVGIYLAWRGDSLTLPGPLRNLSFWDRLNAADRVASGPAATQALLSIVSEVRRNPRSRSAVIGHSMGALIVERSLTQALAGTVVGQSERGPLLAPAGRLKLKYPTDLLVLVNSAAPSLYAKGLVESLSLFSVAPSEPANFSLVGEITGSWRPLILSMTSEGDKATGIAFPLGMKTGSALERFRAYGHQPSTTQGAQADQRYFYTHTPGHAPDLFSHGVTHRKLRDTAISARVSPCEPLGIAETPRQEICIRSGQDEFKLSKTAMDRTMNNTPYWIMQVPTTVIPNHVDIFSPEFVNLLRVFLALANVLNPSADEYKHLTWCSWHEGVRIYDAAQPGTLRPIARIREDCIAAQSHAPDAQALLRSLDEEDLWSIVASLVYTADEEHGVFDCVRVAAASEGEFQNVVLLRDRGDFEAIRRLIYDRLRGRPNARSVLAIVSNGRIGEIIDDLKRRHGSGEVVPPPPPPPASPFFPLFRLFGAPTSLSITNPGRCDITS